MDKDTRDAIEGATQRARKYLEADFAAQLDGDFDVHRDGSVAAKAGDHLSARQAFQRERIIDAIEHKRAAGMSLANAARDYLRDAAFTTLNRFVALKMLEARELVQECITKGEQSAGYREFCGMAPGLPLLPDSAGYRLYIESLFDELSTEVKVLFDRRDPSSVLWPKRGTFDKLLEIFNATELAKVWGEDETIGWVYQFFNREEDRRAARYDENGKPKAPQNSRELAVRNQFFTPRYVVQFLTDNTLGRIWCEMRGTNTVLVEKCEYMVRKSGDKFARRAKKDPRDLRVLDPACGSGHFLLYAFDLLVAIYEEAHADPEGPKSDATGKTLAEDYPSHDALRKAIPGLVLAHNLHGVDIDPRCAQIAQLALWMRAQKAYRDFGIARADRAQIRRSNVVIAEPLVADAQIAKEFVAKLDHVELRRVFTRLVESMSLAGDMGLLLRIEQLVKTPAKEQGDLFAPQEERILATLDQFVREEGSRTNTRRRLFADDAAHGVALLWVADKKFDVVLMNPPFGAPSDRGKPLLDKTFPRSKPDILCAFIERAQELCTQDGAVGAITNRSVLFGGSMRDWRLECMLGNSPVQLLADLGHGVLDGALVEAAAYILGKSGPGIAISMLDMTDKGESLRQACRSEQREWRPLRHAVFRSLKRSPIAYWCPEGLLRAASQLPSVEENGILPRVGIQTSANFRFLRLQWEVACSELASGKWIPFAKGGEYSPFADSVHLCVLWEGGAREQKAFCELHADTTGSQRGNDARRDFPYYFRDGVTYSERTTSDISPRLLVRGCITGDVGPGIYCVGDVPPLATLAVMSTATFKQLLEINVGLGDAVHSGSAARHYTVGTLAQVAFPRLGPSEMNRLEALATTCVMARRKMLHGVPSGSGSWAPALLSTGAKSFKEAAVTLNKRWATETRTVLIATAEIEEIVQRAYGFDDETVRYVESAAGRHPLRIATKNLSLALVHELWKLPEEQLVDRCKEIAGASRAVTKNSWWVDRRVELIATALGVNADALLHSVEAGELSAVDLNYEAAVAFEYLLGRAIGDRSEALQQELQDTHDHRWARAGRILTGAPNILVDDPGHPRDIERAIVGAFAGEWHEADSAKALEELRVLACGLKEDLRTWLRRHVFDLHIGHFSRSRRKAPIYWQLATPSASYSVWLYIHAFSKDTLFRVQNDYAAQKLAHEERRLNSLTNELREGATAAQRKDLALQEVLVEELRAFLDEVKRVAPLWNPNLDDGVIINFAPLWRLIPQNKSWQKEVKATWDALCDGKYDWAHLAMHLWPERVVPKCARDRSLAVAHGLEDEFWVEGSNGKWTARKTPICSMEEILGERTSPAVKSALKSLLEAPAATGTATKKARGKANA